jgi:hypothetical protein
MDSRPPQHPFTRPERAPASNPNHQPSQTSQPAGYPSYALPPQASQPQAMHMPFSTESYATSRRDPFLPTAAQHVRSGSYGIHGGEGAQGERHSAWTNTGTPSQLRLSYTDLPSCCAWTTTITAQANATQLKAVATHVFWRQDTGAMWAKDKCSGDDIMRYMGRIASVSFLSSKGAGGSVECA